ncbi:hypothetical protein ACLBXM_13215 [Xanthobacteraceae bacterium A53D]
MHFVGRLVLFIAAALLATLLVVAAGAFVAGERVTAEVERARLSLLLGNLRTATEANLAIGLSLEQVTALQSRIEREIAADDSVLAIDIFNAQGRSVYSTDRGAVGEDVPKPWLDASRRENMTAIVGYNETVYISRFDNDLGFAGGFAATVSDAEDHARAERRLLHLGWRTLLIAGGAILVAFIACLAFGAVMTRPFRRATQILKGERDDAPQDPSLEHLALQTRRSWMRTEERIDAGHKQLEALDDGI